MSIRDSFVEHFGEEDATRIEEAALTHLRGTNHTDDGWGSDSFRYLFLAAIGYECVGRFSQSHGIVATPADMHGWALEHGHIADHDGDIPDYLALFAGAYVPWINWEEANPDSPLARSRPEIIPDTVKDMFNIHDTEGPS